VPWNGWTETDFRTPMAYTTITRTITYILRLRSGQALRPPGPPDGCRLLHRRVLRVCLRRRRPFRSHSNRLTYSGPGGSHTYTYDAVNRLTSAGGVTYTWDDRGNLTDDGTFTYTTNAAGRLVRAESVTTTLVYTYASTSLSAGTATGLPRDAGAVGWRRVELHPARRPGFSAPGDGRRGPGEGSPRVDAVRSRGGWCADRAGVHRRVAGRGAGADVPPGTVV